MDLSANRLVGGLITYLIVLLSLTAHEWGHAATADRLGDNTPRSQGRVTFNPLAHIDWIGTVLIPLLGVLGMFGSFSLVGWAKPVMINPANLPKKSDQAWVTIAGPGMNLIIALVAAVIAGFSQNHSPGVMIFAELVMRINVSLMLFNLLPIPPLDGSKFLMYWFGMSWETYAKFTRFGWIILMVFLNLPQTRGFLGKLIQWGMEPFQTITSLFA